EICPGLTQEENLIASAAINRKERRCKSRAQKGQFGLLLVLDGRLSGALPGKIASRCRERARRVYYDVVFKIKKESPVHVHLNPEDVMRHSMDWFVRLCVLGMLCLAIGCTKKETGKLPTIPFVPISKQ